METEDIADNQGYVEMKVIKSAAEAIETWEALFKKASHSMFKTEILQDYTAVDDGPSLQAWLHGDKDEAIELARKLMTPWIKQRNENHIPITRVRIIEKSFTPYLEWEMACIYPVYHETYTETIHFLPKENLDNLKLPAGDFWIFDNKIALEWKYAGPHNQTAGAIVYEERHEVDRYLTLQNSLLKKASYKPL